MPRPSKKPSRLLLAMSLPALFALACGSTALIPYNEGPSADRDDSRASIRILSAVPSTPGGACSPPRENSDFICKYQLRLEVEYWLPERAMVSCTAYRDGEDVTSYGEAREPESGTLEHVLQVSNFYPAMGEYTERVECTVHEVSRQGEPWASDEQSFDVSLTTTWED